MEKSKTFKKMLDEAKKKPEWALEEFKIEFAEKLWCWFEKKYKLSGKEDAAKELGISKAMLTLIFKGNFNLKMSDLFRIAHVAKIKIEVNNVL